MTPDGRWLIAARYDGILLYELEQDESSVLKAQPNAFFQQIRVSRDGRWLGAIQSDRGSGQSEAVMWELGTAPPVDKPFLVTAIEPRVIEFSVDCRMVAVGTRNSGIKLWKLGQAGSPQPELLAELSAVSGPVDELAFSENGHWMATGAQGDLCSLFDLREIANGKSPHILRGHDHNIRVSRFSRDSHWLATASLDRTIRLWDLTADDPASESIVLQSAHADLPYELFFTPDGRWLVRMDVGGTVRLWNLNFDQLMKLARQVVGRSLSDGELQRYMLPRTPDVPRE